MNKKRRISVQVAVILIIAGSIFTARYLAMGKTPETKEIIPPPVRVEKPRRRNLEDTYTAFGNLKSANQVSIMPRVAGSVTAMYAEVGDKVQKGTLLAEIDREAYELDLKRAQAAYSSASSTWERIQRLYTGGSSTRQDWENARAAFTAAEAQAAAARLRYDWTLVHSPVEGVVLRKHVNPGSLVAPEAGIPLYTVGSLENLEVDLQIPDLYYSSFSVSEGSGAVGSVKDSSEEEGRGPGVGSDAEGAPLSLPRVSAFADSFPDILLESEITSVSPWINPETRSFTVTCRVRPDEDSRSFLRPGMLLKVTFVLNVKEDVLTLPESALSGGDRVWCVEFPEASGENIAEPQELPHPFASSGFVQVPEEWEDRIFVVEGQYFLKEGVPVRLLEDAPLTGSSE